MSGRWLAVLLLILAAAVGYMATFNAVMVTVHIPFVEPITVATGLLMIVCFVVGLIAALLPITIRDWQDYFRRLSEETRRKQGRLAQERLQRARNFQQIGLLELAGSNLKEAMEKNPELIEALEFQGDLHLQKGELYESTRMHAKALELDPANDAVRWKLAVDYRQAQTPTLAVKILKERLDVDDRSLYLNVRYRDLLFELREWDSAIAVQKRLGKMREYKNLEENLQTLAGLYYEKGRAHLSQKQGDEAVKALEEAVKFDPQLSLAYVKLGEAYVLLEKEKQALKVWALGWRRCGDLAILSRLEEYYLLHDDPSRIINLYIRYLEESPSNTGLRYHFANLLFKLEMLEEAQGQVEEIKRLQEVNNPKITMLAYRLKLKMGDTTGALEELSYLAENCLATVEETICNSCRHKWPGTLDTRCPECGRWGSLRRHI